MLSRIKFEITPLVTEMLDQLPDEIWTSTTTRFFDPAIAGGQFVREIERRLLEAGHSKKNVSGRVFGCEEYEHQVQYALNKYKLLGNYAVTNFLEQDFNMKFDVIVGNPPFQGSNDKGSAQPKSHNLWSKFIDKSITLVKDDGYLAFVTPDSWMSANSQLLRKFKEHSLLWCTTTVGKYFTVGSSFTAWVLQNNQSTTTCQIDNIAVDITKLNYLPRNFHHSYPIHDKVINSNFKKLDVKCDTTCHSDYKHQKLSDTKDSVFKYKTHHTNAQTKFSKLKSKDFNNNKVLWSLSGYFKPFYDNGSIGTTEVCQYVLVADEVEGNNTVSYLNSKLYQFIINTGKWSGFLNGKVIESLPQLPNKMWTDKALYKLFNLTQEEIDYIESNVK